MLAFRQLTIGYHADECALSRIDLDVPTGSALIVTGAAASGKSTLLAAASGIVPKLIRPERLQGVVELEGQAIVDLPATEIYRRIGVVLQSVEDQLWDLSVEDLIAFPLENRAAPPAEIRVRVSALIEQLGIEHLLGRRVQSLSGGERRIAALASALVFRPQLLVLDEPTSGLDPEARRRMIELLRELRRDNLTLLIAEQDLTSFDGIADRVVFLRQGEIVGDHPWAQATRLREPYDRAGIESPFSSAPRPRLPPKRSESSLVVRGLCSSVLRGEGRPVLSGVDLTLGKAEIVGLIGPNGAGKTTLLRSLLGLSPPSAGYVEIDGESTAAWSTAERARSMGYLTQNVRRMFFLLSLLDEVVFSLSGGATGARARAEHGAAARVHLERVGLAEKQMLSPFALSTREQLLLSLVCIEATEPRVVILDEPAIGNDRAGRAHWHAFLARCRTLGSAVLLVSHDLRLIDSVADRVIVLDAGRVVFDGDAAQVWGSEAFGSLAWPRPDRTPAAPFEERHALA